MTQQEVQQKTDQAVKKSQAFGKTFINSSFEVFDAATSVLYYVLGASYGVFAALFGIINDSKAKRQVKEAVNGAKADVTDGAYDIKAKVANSAGPTVNDAKAQASGAAKQAQSKATDVKKQTIAQGKQAQGQFKQTAQANGF